MKKILTLAVIFCTAIIFVTGACPVPKNTSKNIEITKNFNGLYIIKIPKERNSIIKPYVSKSLIYNKDVFAKTGAELVINAGYFDPNNQKTSSYVVIDGETVLDPTTNKSLMENKELKPHLQTILNRTEFRVLSCGNRTEYDIAAHNAKVNHGCKIVHSIQAGPMLYPDLKLSREYFVTKDKDGNVTRDSITALKRCARTVIGIKNGDIYIIIANMYHKRTLPEMYKVCKQLHLDKAMNFDGGGSTSLNYKGTDNPQYKNFEIISDKKASARKLKSFLVIE